jgi:hypothetical protein
MHDWQLWIEAAIDSIKRLQIKWFGHVIRQRKLKITQRVINKKYENTRPTGRPRKWWIEGILEVLGNVTAEEANRRVKDCNVSLPSTPRGNWGREEEDAWLINFGLKEGNFIDASTSSYTQVQSAKS